jgi:outer membrane protein, heavy metal efflux system
MRFRAKLILRLAAVASAAAAPGCISPADPSWGRPLQQPAALPERSALGVLNQPLASQVNGIVRTSASEPVATVAPGVFDPEGAVQFALQNNPLLQAVRQQRGFAQGGVVIARTYPYNPVSQLQFSGVTGDEVTNRFAQVYKISLDVEVRGQRHFRQQAAFAALTRTEWEIATQEIGVSVVTDRAFNTVVYRQRKLHVLEDTIKLNEQVIDIVKKLADAGRLRAADLIVARTELDAAGAQLGQGKAALVVARAELRRQFGTLDDTFTVKGELDIPVPNTEFEKYAEAAIEKRPDLQARRLAVAEAQAHLRLQEADRYGNPSFGPSFEYNETRSGFIGMQFGFPIPVFNRKSGEILQAQATFARAQADARQVEVQATQEVQAALARLAAARKWADSYTMEVLPNLKKATQDMTKLLEQNDPSVDVLKVLGVQRNYLHAFDSYLDALYELSQARDDLAAAVGDPAIALGLYAPSKPAVPPKNP